MFKFTIRELLWLTLVVALGAGWWIDRSRLARDFNELAFNHAIDSATVRSQNYVHKVQRWWP